MSNISAKDDGQVLEKFWDRTDNKSYLNLEATI